MTDFQVRDVPTTDALQEQKMLSMGIEEEWWFRKLQNGRVLDADVKWRDVIPCDGIISDFTAYAEKWKFARRGNETSLGRFLSRMTPHMIREQTSYTFDEIDQDGRPKRMTRRVYTYNFGSLQQCRDAWDQIYGNNKWTAPQELDVRTVETPF